MTEQEFRNEKQFLKGRIKTFKDSIELLEKEYIETNKPFKIGDRIRNTTYGDFGFVNGFELDYNDNIKPIAYKEKKDGTPSKQNMYIYNLDQVELAPKTS